MHWFLQDLQAARGNEDLEFSYCLPTDLKLTLHPKPVASGDNEFDEERDFEQSTMRDIDEQFIDIQTKMLEQAGHGEAARMAREKV